MSEGLWELPVSWKWVCARDIADIVGGGTPAANDPSNFDNEGTPWITPADLSAFDGSYIGRGRRGLSDKGLASSSARVLPGGSVLFSSRAPIGYCVIAANALATNQGFKSLVLRKGILPTYIRYYLVSATEYIESLASGTTFKEISGSKMGEVLIPLAPLAEQRRIVERIEVLFARIRRTRVELERALTLARLFTSRQVDAIVDSCRDAGCPERTLGELIIETRNGISAKPEDEPPGIPILRISAVRPGRVTLNDIRFHRANESNAERPYLLRERDLLFVRFNGNPDLVAVCGMVRRLNGPTVYPDKLIRIRLDERIAVPEFVEIAMSSTMARRQLARYIKTAAGQHGISGSDLRSVRLLLPDVETQISLAKAHATRQRQVEDARQDTARALALLDHLEQAILRKAFRGELVPQDPADDPAEVLSERFPVTGPESRRRRKSESRIAS